MGEYEAGAVIGLSSLREKEETKATARAALSDGARKHAEYLQRYVTGEAATKPKKRKGERKRARRDAGAKVKILDEDVQLGATGSALDSQQAGEGVVENRLLRRAFLLQERERQAQAGGASGPAVHDDDEDDDDDGALVVLTTTARESPPVREAPPRPRREAARRHDSDSDASVERAAPAGVRRAAAPARPRHDSDSDVSVERPAPARAQGGAAARRRQDSDSDVSVERPAPARGQGGAAARLRQDSDDSKGLDARVRGARVADAAGAPGVGRGSRDRHDSDSDMSVERRGGARAGGSAPGMRPLEQSGRDESAVQRQGPERGTAGEQGASRAGGRRGQTRARLDSDSDVSVERAPGPAEQAGARGSRGADGDTSSGRQRSTGQPVHPQDNAMMRGRGLEHGAGEADGTGGTGPPDGSSGGGRGDMDTAGAGGGGEAEGAMVFRVDGRIVSKDEYRAHQEQRAAARRRKPKFIEESVVWQGGLVQKRAREQLGDRMRDEGAKNFQREFDMDADRALQQEQRSDDPMHEYLQHKLLRQAPSNGPQDLKDRYQGDLVTDSGFNVPQQVPIHSWLRRGAQPMPNRYNIKPGRHWDGVHRSNGFEKSFVFQFANNKRYQEQSRYADEEDL